MTTSRTERSRLAPSPTGALHLGNARTFLINWALARQRGWELILRIEDLDSPRVKPDSVRQTMEILRWLGIDHDGDILIQSHDLDPYRAAMRKLADANLIYASDLSRSQIEAAASAPHENEHELRFPASLRPTDPDAFIFTRDEMSYRFVVPDRPVALRDEFSGDSAHNVAEQVGDFVVWTKRGVPAYQLAVVVDDARQGVSDVVRGDDLLPSAARQTLLHAALGHESPRWWHLPLVLGPDGRRLAKRHGNTRIDSYRAAGVTSQRIIGLLARWSGIVWHLQEMDASDFRDAFDPARLSPCPVTFNEGDHRWLLSG